MTNKEKEKHIKLKVGMSSYKGMNTETNKTYIFDSTPKTLYKYRKFDKEGFTFHSIDNNYVYLANASSLDDPFDCLTTSDSIIDFQSLKLKLTSENIEYISEIFASSFCSDKRSQKFNNVKRLAKLVMKYSKIDNVKEFDYLNKDEKKLYLKILKDLYSVRKILYSNERLNEILNLFINAKDLTKVCALTTKRDNKVMWSQYADNYKGCCIEYDIPRIDEVIRNLFPVIYKKKYNNSVSYAFLEMLIGEYVAYLKKIMNIIM